MCVFCIIHWVCDFKKNVLEQKQQKKIFIQRLKTSVPKGFYFVRILLDLLVIPLT